MKLLLLGATGLVGSETLRLVLAGHSSIEVVAPTRTPIAPHARLINPIGSRLEKLIPDLTLHRPDAVICALGTTQAKAGSKQAFRYVDHDLPVAFATAAHAAGVATFVIVTAAGASEDSMSFYYRTKGEVERDIKEVGFRSLTICRPSLIGGKRNEVRRAEGAAIALMRFLGPLLPKRFQINPADVIAAALLDAVIKPESGCRYIAADDMN
jgi:uncharacterized protein YbjT (DUF2867 family)